MTAVHARDWTLRRRLAQAFGAVGVVLVLLVAAVIVTAITFGHAGNEVIYRWQPAVAATDEVVADLVNQETGVRGYALLRNRDFLEPYTRFAARENRDRAELRRLLGDDGELQQRYTALTAATRAWRADVATPAIAALDAGDIARATRIVGEPSAKARFDVLRGRADSLADAVRARAADARDSRRTTGVVFAVAGGVLLLVVVASGLVLRRGLDRWVLTPMTALGSQTREVASGDTHRQITPGGPNELVSLGNDVEAMRRQIAAELERAEQIGAALRRRGEELARSNEDLQQFAYVASHDLSEPLRKVANFCQLLERQYGPQLDDKARQYIAFAVDGAKRMQALISDLLSLSRVGRSTDSFVRVELDAAAEIAVDSLGERIADSGATVERLTSLPAVEGDRALLTSLLQNLIGNAIKYRRPDVAPVVTLAAERGPDPGCWTFTVRDNGIGIDAQYAQRIFVVFQRLHLRDEYGGTGIGLALCRRIVESHGGRIWLADVQSETQSPSELPGATFRFTLPEAQERAHAEPND